MTKMARREYREVYGIEPPKRLTKAEARRAHEINALFDSAEHELGMGSLEVFTAAASGLHGAFLKNVSDCPLFVITDCQRRLADHSNRQKK